MRALKIWPVLLLLLPICARAQATSKVQVVATFSILGDMVKNVGGDKVSVDVLVGPNADVHTFEPTPQQNVALLKTQVIFENGLHLEPWLDKLYDASGSKAKRVVVSEDVDPIKIPGTEDADPHIWQDVANAMIMVEHIQDGLAAADPADKAYFHSRAEQYLARLADLDHRIIETLKDVSDEQRKLVTSHDTMGYFAKRYGFQIIGAAIESATTEAADPSAAQIAALIDKVKASGVKAVFVENTHNPKVLQTIAAEAKVLIAPPLYTDALGPQGSGAETYITMMEHNAQVLAQSLQ